MLGAAVPDQVTSRQQAGRLAPPRIAVQDATGQAPSVYQ